MNAMMYKKRNAKMCKIICIDKSQICVGENNRGMYGIMPTRV